VITGAGVVNAGVGTRRGSGSGDFGSRDKQAKRELGFWDSGQASGSGVVNSGAGHGGGAGVRNAGVGTIRRSGGGDSGSRDMEADREW
jgi:hypothetical protein